eukprot:PhF_6_TR38049/c0_g2_i1/m.56775
MRRFHLALSRRGHQWPSSSLHSVLISHRVFYCSTDPPPPSSKRQYTPKLEMYFMPIDPNKKRELPPFDLTTDLDLDLEEDEGGDVSGRVSHHHSNHDLDEDTAAISSVGNEEDPIKEHQLEDD